jgi:hypothetical protein
MRPSFYSNPKSGIHELLADLNDKGNVVIGFKENKELLRQDRAVIQQQFEQTNGILLKIFPDALTKLTAAIGEYVNFHNL